MAAKIHSRKESLGYFFCVSSVFQFLFSPFMRRNTKNAYRLKGRQLLRAIKITPGTIFCRTLGAIGFQFESEGFSTSLRKARCEACKSGTGPELFHRILEAPPSIASAVCTNPDTALLADSSSNQRDQVSSFRHGNRTVRFTLEGPFANSQHATLHLASTCEDAPSSIPRTVVVKVIRMPEVNQARAMEKAEKFKHNQGNSSGAEQKRLIELRHPNVVRYFAVDVLKPTQPTESVAVRLIMEYCAGGDLARALNETAFDVSKIVNYTRQILSGLSYLHQARTIHGDIKPHNIFMTTENSTTVLKLGDLDDRVQIAKPVTGTKAKHAIGTLLYMSPEMVGQELQTEEIKNGKLIKPGRSTDIWSVGCVMLDMYMVSKGEAWRCVTKPHPSSSGESEVIMASITRTADGGATAGWDLNGIVLDQQSFRNYILSEGTGIISQYPSHVPPDLREFLDNCFQINPGFRPTADQLLNHRFLN